MESPNPTEENTRLWRGIKGWFDDYVAVIVGANPGGRKPLVMKLDHTFRVLRETEIILKSMPLPDSLEELARINALLHDIGRFEQYVQYGTFADHLSCNHAELSVKIIERELLPALSTTRAASIRHLILRPIAFHNRISIPDGEDKEVLLLTRLLRDADKIDILRIVLSVLEGDMDVSREDIFLGLSDESSISHPVLQNVLAGKPVRYSDMVYKNDFIVLELGWVFDIHFDTALRRISEIGLLRGLLGHLPEGQSRNRLEWRIFTYIEERLRQ